MDDLERKLYHDLSSGVKIPDKVRTVIEESIKYTNIKKKKYSFLKIAVTTCASLILTVGIVYAGKAIYDEIWKAPEKTVGFYNNDDDIKIEDSGTLMNEDEARKKAEYILQKFECNDENIKEMKIENRPNDYQINWCITTDNNTIIRFDAYNGKNLKIFFKNLLNEDIEGYRTTKVEAEKTAREICEKYGYNLEKYNNIQVYSNLANEKESYIWYVDFYKEYDGIINPYENISIGFIPEINKLYYFIVQDLKYENNPIEITNEQAQQVVLEAEEKINTKYQIQNIYTNIAIACMNGNAYLRLTDYEQYCKQLYQEYPSEFVVEYRTDNRVRKVWKVTLEYNNSKETVNNVNEELNPLLDQYTYYIDATTGEIIGGTTIDVN